MDIDIAGLMVQWFLYGIGALFVAVWESALQHPWMFLIAAGLVVLALTGGISRVPTPRRRRRYGYR
jgi:hypothetical protein